MPLIFIIIVSVITRLFALDLMEFKSDQAFTILQLKNSFDTHQLITSGLVSSIGIKNFPLFNYLLLPFGYISLDPQFLTTIIAIANILAIIGFYLIVKKFYGQLAAFFAALIYATSPWAILFSRSIWAQDLIPVFLVPFIYFLLKKSWLPLGIFTALLIQLHLSGVFLLIALITALKAKLDWKRFCIGFALGFIPALPYILSTDQGTFLTMGQKNWDLNNFIRPIQILTGGFFEFELGKNYSDFLATFPFIRFLNFLNYLILIPMFVYLKKQRDFLFPTIILVIPLLYFILKTPSYMHYYIISLPFLILISAIGLKFMGKIGYLICLIFVTSNLLLSFYFYKFISQQKNIAGDYGSIYSLIQKNISENTKEYTYLPYYENLKLYLAVYPLEKIHLGLANAFISAGNINLAKKEIDIISKTDPQTALQLSKIAGL